MQQALSWSKMDPDPCPRGSSLLEKAGPEAVDEHPLPHGPLSVPVGGGGRGCSFLGGPSPAAGEEMRRSLDTREDVFSTSSREKDPGGQLHLASLQPEDTCWAGRPRAPTPTGDL